MTTALITGGGVAGPVAAMALQRAGIDATIYEARPGGADDVGAFLTLQSNGMDALRAIDAHHVAKDLGFPTPLMRFYSGTGKYLGARFPTAPCPTGRSATPSGGPTCTAHYATRPLTAE
jgi:FAD-dependent urate hydroxylase